MDGLGVSAERANELLCFMDYSFLKRGLAWRRGWQLAHPIYGVTRRPERWFVPVVKKLPQRLVQATKKSEQLLQFSNVRFSEQRSDIAAFGRAAMGEVLMAKWAIVFFVGAATDGYVFLELPEVIAAWNVDAFQILR